MSILGVFYNAQRSLLNNQAALSVVSNNISNMNTEGYSKQRVETASVSDSSASNLTQQASAGMGAELSEISRSRDVFLDNYYRSETSDLASLSELSSVSSLIEDIMNELDDSGLKTSLGAFYEAAQSLSLNPTDTVTKTDFVEKAIDVCNTFNHTAQQLEELRETLVGDISDPSSLESSKVQIYCDSLNSKVSELAKLNEKIATTSTGGATPNALLDQRDKLLDEISEYIPIETSETSTGLVNVTTSGVSIIKGLEVKGIFEVTVGDDNNPAIVKIVDDQGNDKVSDITAVVDSGKINALLEICGNTSNELTIKNVLDDLDRLAVEFANQVNSIQLYSDAGPPAEGSACIDTSVTPNVLKRATENIFVDSADTTANISATDIMVNQSVIDNPAEIATAVVDMDDNGASADTSTWFPLDNEQVGNNESALKFAQLSNLAITSTNGATANGLNGSTTEGFVTSLVGSIGVDIESINTQYETQDTIVEQISLTRESSYGVNLDEELVDLTKYQRAYEASARIFSVANDVMEQIINLGR